MFEAFRQLDPDAEYKAAVDSVNLINSIFDEGVSEDDQEAIDTIHRNKEHLKIIVAKDHWDGYDLTPIHAAIARTE